MSARSKAYSEGDIPIIDSLSCIRQIENTTVKKLIFLNAKNVIDSMNNIHKKNYQYSSGILNDMDISKRFRH